MNTFFSRLHRPDLLAAAQIGAVGLAGLWFGRGLPFGTAASMQAGYLPLGISGILVLIAVALFVRSIVRGNGEIARFAARPAAVLILATALFGILLERIGLAPTVFIVAVIATFAGDRLSLVMRLALAASLSVGCVVLFVYLLGQPIPVWWWGS